MFKTTVMTGIAVLTIGAATLGMRAPAWSQAVIHPVAPYSAENSEFRQEHYRHSDEDRSHDDNAFTEFDEPAGEGVR